jgi:LCP family protein required for cell wall assembly
MPRGALRGIPTAEGTGGTRPRSLRFERPRRHACGGSRRPWRDGNRGARTLGAVFEKLLSRRSVIAALVGAPLAAAGCSEGDSAPQQTSSAPSPTTTTPPPPPPPAVTGRGLPADLLQALTALYLGGTVQASAELRKALAARKPGTASLAVAGTTGSWKGTPIAAVAHGKDLTLLVKTTQWVVVGGWWPSLGVARVARPAKRVLAIGSDARVNQRPEKARADALQIIGVDNQGVGGIVGVPRDSYVALSSGGMNKINAALVFGGPKGVVSTVRRATGIPIDGYVMAGFKGFQGMVAALGGITFVSKTALKSVTGLQLLVPGTNKLNSSTALWLARERKNLPNGDFGRSANQGLLIKAGIAMLQAAGPAALPGLLTRMGPHLVTDLPPAEVLNLSATAFLTPAASIPGKVAMGSVGMRGGQSVVILGGAAKATFGDLKDGRLGK